jgi:hypothetical protein
MSQNTAPAGTNTTRDDPAAAREVDALTESWSRGVPRDLNSYGANDRTLTACG